MKFVKRLLMRFVRRIARRQIDFNNRTQTALKELQVRFDYGIQNVYSDHEYAIGVLRTELASIQLQVIEQLQQLRIQLDDSLYQTSTDHEYGMGLAHTDIVELRQQIVAIEARTMLAEQRLDKAERAVRDVFVSHS